MAGARHLLGLFLDLAKELVMLFVEVLVALIVLLHMAVARALRRVYRTFSLLETRGWDLGCVPLISVRKVLGAAALSTIKRFLVVRLRLARCKAVGELGLLVVSFRCARYVMGVTLVLRTILLCGAFHDESLAVGCDFEMLGMWVMLIQCLHDVDRLVLGQDRSYPVAEVFFVLL